MTHTLSYPFADIPPSATRHEVAPGVYWLRFPLPFALDHINLWLLADDAGWTVVDTGLGVRPSQKIWKALLAEQLDGKPLTRVVVTHYHPDHLGLAGWLEQETGAQVLISRGEWSLAKLICHSPEEETVTRLKTFLGSHGLGGDALEKVAGKGNGFRRVVQPLPVDPVFLAAGEPLTIDGKSWVIHVGCGHSPEHLCLYREEDHLLISGDQVLPAISSNLNVRAAEPDADPVTDFVTSLEALRDNLPADTLVLPAHGLPFRGLGARVDALVRHHEEQLDRVQAACQSQPMSAFDMLPVLFQRPLDVQQLMFAMGESIAHLNCLMRQGRVERQQVSGTWMFNCLT